MITMNNFLVKDGWYIFYESPIEKTGALIALDCPLDAPIEEVQAKARSVVHDQLLQGHPVIRKVKVTFEEYALGAAVAL